MLIVSIPIPIGIETINICNFTCFPFYYQDNDHDNRISFKDFEITLQEEPLLLEAFGNCLPEPEVSALRERAYELK